MEHTVKKAAKGLSLIMTLKLFTKFLQLFLNFAVVRMIDPEVYGLSFYFIMMTNLQTFLVKDCLREASQKRSSEGVSTLTSRKSSRNLIVFGFYFTIVLTIVLFTGFSYFYSSMHRFFILSCAFFSLSSILQIYGEACLVYPILDFNYNISALSESVGFTVNTLLQFGLIRLLDIDACLAFGISIIISSLVRIGIIIYMCKREHDYPVGLTLEKIQFVKGKNGFVLPEMATMAKQVSFISFLASFTDQFYVSLFLKNTSFIGKIALIKNFSNVVIRFIFSPIDV